MGGTEKGDGRSGEESNEGLDEISERPRGNNKATNSDSEVGNQIRSEKADRVVAKQIRIRLTERSEQQG